jgi:hypothetical protein
MQGSSPRRELLFAFSLANLILIPTWHRVLWASANNQFYLPDYYHNTYLAALLNMLWIALAVFGLRLLVLKKTVNAEYFRLGTLALLLLPLNYARIFITIDRPYRQVASIVFTLIVAAMVFALYPRGPGRSLRRVVVRGLELVTLVFAPLLVFTASQSIQHLVQPEPKVISDPYPGTEPKTALAAPKHNRVVWIIFDELGQEPTFLRRPADLELPALDRLRKEAIYASNAHSPATVTAFSVPSLLNSRLVSSVRADRDHLELGFDGAPEHTPWKEVPTLFFKRAAADGAHVAVSGWYFPYCEMFHEVLTACSWEPYSVDRTSPTFPVSQAMLRQLGRLSPMYNRERHRSAYEGILKSAKAALTDPNLDVVFVHFSVPHPPNIYDRRTNTFVRWSWKSSRESYYDNVALVDRTVAQLRTAMEQAGTWDNTNLLITSDHADRNGRSADLQHVPFLLKLAQQHEGATFEPRIDTLHASDLLLSIYENDVTTSAQALTWLDKIKSTTSQ